jgi:hypothetical protein
MQLLSRLMPRERQFFELFNQHADYMSRGSVALANLLQTYDDQANRGRQISQIEELEHAADRVTRETVALLHTTFVTPLDRDDIHRLISRMDDILDLIQDTAETLMLYDIQKLTPETVHLGDLVKICCERVQSAVGLLSSMANSPAILKICQEIDGLESDADRVMRAAVSKLFRDEGDVRQIIKLKAVYELLEAATDRCQDVANIIEGVVLQHA